MNPQTTQPQSLIGELDRYLEPVPIWLYWSRVQYPRFCSTDLRVELSIEAVVCIDDCMQLHEGLIVEAFLSRRKHHGRRLSPDEIQQLGAELRAGRKAA